MAKTNQQIIVTEGDFGVEILTQIIDANKKPVPIEGCSCKIKFEYNGNVISERTGIVIDEPKGIVSVILDTEETQYSGLWTSYWICYDQFNNVTTTENIYYYVQPAIGSVNNPAFTELLNYYNRDEVNDMFKSILEQLNNYTLTKDDVEKYIRFYVQNKIDDDFVRQCIVDAIGNGSDYVKKEQVEKINSQLTNEIETINSQMDTKANKSDVETINSQLDTIANRFVTPEMYGAKGDGVTDDTLAFKTACSKKKGVMLTGKYRITSQCELYNVNIFSLNNGSIVCDTGSEFTLNLTGNCTIKSVIFSGVNCILITNLRNKVYNCTFGKYGSERVGTHIKFKGTEWYGENIIDKNMFIGGGEFNLDFRENTHPATDNYITNNVFAYSKNSIIGTLCGTIISHNHDYSIEGMYIDGNDLKIDNNYFDNGNHTSIDISAQSSLSICNNVFYSTTADPVDLINFRRGINCVCTGNTVGGYTGDVTLFNLNDFYFKSSFENNQCKKIAKNISNQTMIASKGLSGETTFYFNDEQYTLTQKISNNMVFVNINSSGSFKKGKIGRIGLTGFLSDTILNISCNEGVGFAKLYASTGEVHILTPETASNISIIGTIPY